MLAVEPMTTQRLKKYLFRTVYLLVTPVLMLVILEGTARLFHLAPPLPEPWGANDPYLPFKPDPLSVIQSRREEFQAEYRHNSFGFRDVEHSLAKPPGVFRILALGDSFTYGIGAAFQDTFLFRLEEQLNRRPGNHPRVEIIKAGIPRYFPEAERLLLEHYGVSYSPDLIMVVFVPNDVSDTHLGIDAVKVGESGYLVNREAEHTSRLVTYLYIKSHVARIIMAYAAGIRPKKEWQGHGEDIYKANGFFEHDWQTIESEYQKILRITNSIGARSCFVHIPQRGDLTEERGYPAARLSQWSIENRTSYIDTLPALKEAQTSQDLYYKKDGHCRPEGYRVISEVLFRALTEGNSVP